MEYKKYEKDNYNIHLINTNRFKGMSIVVFLTKKFDKKDLVFGNVLSANLVYTTKKYNTKNEIAAKGEELYGAKISSSFGVSGNCESFVFSLDFLNPKYTDEKYLSESLDFLCEVLFNPNVENNEFHNDYFNIIMNDKIAQVESVKDNPSLFASIEYGKIMYKGTPTEYSSIPTLEELKKVNPKNLYEFYQTLFTGNYNIDIAIFGETEESVVELVDSKFKHIKGTKEKLRFDIEHKYEDKVEEKIDSLPFNQSKLYVGYRLNDITYHELHHVLKVYNTILGTMNDSILFNIVREENSLCYSISSYISRYNPALTIYAGINKSNYEKTLTLIKECVELMKDRKTLERLFDSAKKTINTYLNNYYDDLSSQINRYYNAEYTETEDVETLRKNINEVTIEEVIEINKKISLATIYLLKGDNND